MPVAVRLIGQSVDLAGGELRILQPEEAAETYVLPIMRLEGREAQQTPTP